LTQKKANEHVALVDRFVGAGEQGQCALKGERFSYVFGTCTGQSTGCSPLRTRST